MTATLYAVDGQADQQAYEEYQRAEQQRRDDLIERAVTSFAPELVNKPGIMAVYLYSSNAGLRKFVRSICGADVVLVEYCKADGRERRGRHEIQQEGADVWLDIPKKADLVATKSALNFKVQLFAGQLGALPVVLPEAQDYVMARLKKQGALIIVGADQGRKA